jgi:hypothetical protein
MKELLTVRKSLKDAFVYGELTSSINSDSKDVYGYYFQARQDDVITLVNVSSKDYMGNIYLPKALHRSK